MPGSPNLQEHGEMRGVFMRSLSSTSLIPCCTLTVQPSLLALGVRHYETNWCPGSLRAEPGHQWYRFSSSGRPVINLSYQPALTSSTIDPEASAPLAFSSLPP